MRRAVLLAACGALASADTQLIWSQHQDAAVYTSSAITRHPGAAPSFSTSTWLNTPIYVEVYNVSDNGQAPMWSFEDPNREAVLQVDMARHAEAFGTGAVDTVAGDALFGAAGSCILRAWSSLGDGTPAWSYTVPDCASSFLYDSDRFVDMSDDGSTVAMSGYVNVSLPQLAPVLVVLDGQTGALRFKAGGDGSVKYGGPVQVTEHGTWIAWTDGDSVTVLSGATGAVRDTVAMNWNTMAQLSDDGSFLAFAGEDVGSVYAFDAASGKYALKYSLTPPNGGTWYSISCAVSSDGSGAEMGELVSFSWIDGASLQARVTTYSMVTGALLTDYLTTKNTQLQTNPTVRMDGSYTALALWGDNDDTPTAVLLKAGSNDALFNYTTPGSMFAVDVVLDGTSLYFSVAGKATPANEMGNGGDAYTWRMTPA